MDISRLDRIVGELERLYSEADEIFDRCTDLLMVNAPRGASWGQTKYDRIAFPAGPTFNRIRALKIVRSALTGGSR
jgi:hypothetical protein